MNVSPLDLRQQRFRRTLRGFDPVEVTSLLMAVAEDYEHALRETDRLRQDLAARLPERLRQVFLMRSRNMTIEQIAESLGRPTPTIQSYVSLAIATIKKDLAKERK